MGKGVGVVKNVAQNENFTREENHLPKKSSLMMQYVMQELATLIVGLCCIFVICQLCSGKMTAIQKEAGAV